MGKETRPQTSQKLIKARLIPRVAVLIAQLFPKNSPPKRLKMLYIEKLKGRHLAGRLQWILVLKEQV